MPLDVFAANLCDFFLVLQFCDKDRELWSHTKLNLNPGSVTY